MLYGHGNDLHNQGYTINADFSSNVAPSGMPESLKMHIQKNLHLLENYPAADAEKAAKAIAQHHSVDPQHVIVTNGSTEAFYLVAHLFRGKHSLIVTPSFAEYEDAARCHQHKITFLPNHRLKIQLAGIFNCVWLANPNNPDGYIWSSKYLGQLCSQNPNTYFVVDESYTNLCAQTESLIKRAMLPNLIVIRSLTKDFCLPGLRIGYLIASPSITQAINNIRMPWSVNALAQEATQFIMHNYDDLLPSLESIYNESQQVQKIMNVIPQLEITPSPCNYFLLKTRVSDAATLKSYLLEKHGFLIRDASNFRTLSKSHFRIAIQTPELNNQLITAIQSWISLQH